MLARCIVNDLSFIKNENVLNRLRDYIHLDGPDSDLIIGKTYPVQAIENRGAGWWYYIHSVEINDYPYPFPAEFFEVLDNALPSAWHINMEIKDGQAFLKRLSFPEWSNDDCFYEKLVDNELATKAVYLTRRLNR